MKLWHKLLSDTVESFKEVRLSSVPASLRSSAGTLARLRADFAVGIDVNDPRASLNVSGAASGVDQVVSMLIELIAGHEVTSAVVSLHDCPAAAEGLRKAGWATAVVELLRREEGLAPMLTRLPAAPELEGGIGLTISFVPRAGHLGAAEEEDSGRDAAVLVLQGRRPLVEAMKATVTSRLGQVCGCLLVVLPRTSSFGSIGCWYFQRAC